LHLVSRVDYIYTISNGQIAEQGTYVELMSKDGPFARLMKEFGGDQDRDDEGTVENEIQDTDAKAQAKRDEAAEADGGKGRFLASKAVGKAAGTGKIEGRLIRSEKRTVGSLSRDGAFFIARK
jgi:ATP-binding cassette subfamily C (CFTR/MRP) protein 1